MVIIMKQLAEGARAVFLTVIMFTSTLVCWAHDPLVVSDVQYHFRNISIEDGLPSSAINDVIQRTDQFIWLGTRNGLVKYLGHSFKTYRYDKDNPNSLGSNDVITLLEDTNNQLWVGTDSGLYQFLDNTDQFTKVIVNPEHPNSSILSIYQSNNQNIWVGSENGISKLTPEGVLIQHWSYQNTQIISNDDIKFIQQDNNGVIWFGSKRGLYYIVDSNVSRINFNEKNFDIRDERFFDGKFKNGVLWLATDGDGLLKFDTTKKQLISQWLTSNSEIQSNDIWSLQWHKNTLAIAYFYDGFSLYFEDSKKIDHIRHQSQVTYSLPYNEVSSLFFEDNGLLWAGTTDGLAVTHLNNRDIKHIGLFQGLTNQHVWSTALDDKHLWIGHEDGISILDRTTGVIENHIQNQSVLDKTIVWQLEFDKHNSRLWMGTNKGVYYLDKNQIKPFTFKQPVDVGGIPLPVYALSISDDKLYIAYKLGGHIIVDLTSLSITAIPEQDVLKNVIDVDPFKSSWLIANRQSIKAISKDIALNWINQWLAENNIQISTVLPTEQFIWVGSRRNGVYRFDMQNETIKNIDLSNYQLDGTSTQVQAMVRSQGSDLWISTNQSIYKIIESTLDVQRLTSNFHWLKMEFNQNASSLLNNGKLAFSGSRGVVIFDESKRQPWSFDPKIALTEISIMGDIRYIPATQNATIDLQPDETFYRLSFSSLDHLAPDRVQFKYRLLPNDLDWQTLSANGELTLSRLPYGQHTVEVHGSNSDGVWSDNPVVVQLNVISPWYWNNYSKLLYLAILIALIVWLVKNSRSRIKAADYVATHDPLTQLPNRLLLKKYLVNAVDQAVSGQLKLAVLFLDLNKFKPINDTYGHAVGDEFLIEFSQRLRSAVRNDDLIARLSGDEFVIVVTSTFTQLDIDQVIEHIYQSLSKPYTNGSIELRIETSIGVCLYDGSQPRPKISTLIKRADEAMYICKQQNKDYVIYQKT